MNIPCHTLLGIEKKRGKNYGFLLSDTPGNKTSVIPRRNWLSDSSLTETPKSSLSFGQEQWRLSGSGLSAEEGFGDREHLHLSSAGAIHKRLHLRKRTVSDPSQIPRTVTTRCRELLFMSLIDRLLLWRLGSPQRDGQKLPGLVTPLQNSACLICATLCLKQPLAFVMFGACGLQLQNLLPKLMRQCFPDSLWLYYSLIVFMLLFFCCYFQGSAPANPGSVVRTGPHGKQLPLLWDLTSSPPPSLSLGLYISVYIKKKLN